MNGKIEQAENQQNCYRKKAEKFMAQRKYKEACESWQTFAYFVASAKVLQKTNNEGLERIAKNNGGIK